MKRVFKNIIWFLFYFQFIASVTAQNGIVIWEKMPDYGGGKIGGAMAFTIGAKVYACMGNDGLVDKKDCWQYDPKVNSWKKMANFPGPARSEGVAFTIGDRAYIATGHSGSGDSRVEMKDLWEYNPWKDSWTKKADIGGERYGAIGFSIGGKGYIGLGLKTGQLNCYNDLWEYTPQTNEWIKKTDFPEKGRVGASAFVIKEKATVLLGKKSMEMTAGQKTVFEYDTKKNQWVKKNDFQGSPRLGAIAFPINNKGYVFDGNNGRNISYKDVWEYDAVSDQWHQKPDAVSGDRSNAFSVVIDSTAYIGTGENENLSLGMIYSGKNDFWSMKVDNKTRVDYNAKLLYQKDNQNSPLAQQGVSLLAEEKVIRTATTNANGEFSFEKVDIDGNYKVVLEKSNKIPTNAVVAIAKPNGAITQKLGISKNGLFEYELSKIDLLEEEDDTFFNLEYFIHGPDKEITIRTYIYYQSGSWELLPEGISLVDKLIKALYKYNNLTLEISSHTDSNGDDANNMQLSEERAQTVVNYITTNSINIVEKGIDAKRISGKGLGESKIINRCTNGVSCYEEEHRQNRRTEFKFIKP